MVGYPVTNDISIPSLVTTCANSPEYTCPVTQLKSTSNRDADAEILAEVRTLPPKILSARQISKFDLQFLKKKC